VTQATRPDNWNQQIIEEFRANGGKVGGYFEGAQLGRPGARWRHCCCSVSPGRPPNPPCDSHRNGLSVSGCCPAMRVLSMGTTGSGSGNRGSGTG
jgi:hypothetical protein